MPRSETGESHSTPGQPHRMTWSNAVRSNHTAGDSHNVDDRRLAIASGVRLKTKDLWRCADNCALDGPRWSAVDFARRTPAYRAADS